MKRLLSYQDNRIINILYELCVNRDYITVKEIQEMNQCSDRTVIKDLDYINNCDKTCMYIDFLGDSVRLRKGSLGNLRKFIQLILQQSNHINIMLSIFWYPYENIEFHAENAHISPSHAQRSLINISEFLEQHSAQLSKSKGSYYIEGKSEQNLRFLFAEIMIEYQAILDYFPSKEFMNELLEILKTTLSNYNLKVNDLHLHNLNIIFFLSILRESQGFSLHSKVNFMEDFESDLRSYNSEGIFKEKAIHSGLEQIAVLIQSYKHYQAYKKEIEEELDKFISTLGKEKESFPRIAEITYQYLILKINYPLSLNKILDRSSLYGQKLREQNPVIMQEISTTIAKSNFKYKQIIHNNIDDLIFWVTIESPDFRLTRPKNILVLSDFGDKHAYDLKLFITDHFPMHQINSLGVLRGVPENIERSIKDNDFEL